MLTVEEDNLFEIRILNNRTNKLVENVKLASLSQSLRQRRNLKRRALRKRLQIQEGLESVVKKVNEIQVKWEANKLIKRLGFQDFFSQ